MERWFNPSLWPTYYQQEELHMEHPDYDFIALMVLLSVCAICGTVGNIFAQ